MNYLKKKEISPAAIKPKEAPFHQPQVTKETPKTILPPESKPKNEWIKAASQKIKNYVQAYMTKFERVQTRLQKRLPFIRERLYNIPVKVRRAMLILGAGFFAFMYFVVCLPLMVIARKLKLKHAWLIWIPVVQIFYFAHMAKRPVWAGVFLFLPILNLILLVIFFVNILTLLKKPRWVILLLIVPGINIFTLWYLAMARITQVTAEPIQM